MVLQNLLSPLCQVCAKAIPEGEGFVVSSLRSELRVEDSRTVRVGGQRAHEVKFSDLRENPCAPLDARVEKIFRRNLLHLMGISPVRDGIRKRASFYPRLRS
jgi:hypothetical protein